jgi:hypothetical protein
VPVTSEARFTRPVETTPAVARRTPVKFPTESEPKKPLVDDAYVAERFVVDAFDIMTRPENDATFVFGSK